MFHFSASNLIGQDIFQTFSNFQHEPGGAGGAGEPGGAGGAGGARCELHRGNAPGEGSPKVVAIFLLHLNS